MSAEAGARVLGQLARQVLTARDGRGEWRPMRAAVATLVADGSDLGIASAAVEAVANLAADLRTLPPGRRLRDHRQGARR